MDAGKRFALAMEKVMGYPRYGADIAKEYGVTTQAISQLKKKEKTNDLMRQIAKDKGISLSWLEFGEGEMLKQPQDHIQIGNGNSAITGSGNSVHVGMVREDAPVMYGGKEEIISIPYRPDVYASAGGGAPAYLSGQTPVQLSRAFMEGFLGVSNAKGLHIINVVGDSMEPTLKNGELIFVNPIENEGFRDGGIYVMMCGDSLLVKRVRKNPITNAYTLISDNPNVEDMELAKEGDHGCKFIGRVVGQLERV